MRLAIEELWKRPSTGPKPAAGLAARLAGRCFPCPPMCWDHRGEIPGQQAHPDIFIGVLPSRRLRPKILTREQALELTKAFLRADRDGDDLRHER